VKTDWGEKDDEITNGVWGTVEKEFPLTCVPVTLNKKLERMVSS